MSVKRSMFRSIRARFLLITTVLIITLFGGLGVFIARQNAAEINKSLHSKAKSVADLASLTGAENLENFNFIALDSLVEDILKDPDVSYAGFYNDKKELVTKSPVPASAHGLHAIERELKTSADSAAVGTLKIGYKTDAVTRSVKNSVMTLVGGTLLAILLFAAGIGTAAERIILGPIGRVSEVVEAVAGGDLSRRLEVSSDDEMGVLSGSLNSMNENLSQMIGKINFTVDELNAITGKLIEVTGKVVAAAQVQSEGVSNTSSAVTQINASIKGVSESVQGLSIAATESASSILEMTSSSEEVALNTETLARSVTDVSSSINQMAASIKQVNASVRNLMDASSSTASSVMEMDYSIRQVETNVADASRISATVRQDAEIGRSSLDESIAGIQEIKRSSRITIEAINSLSGKVADIGAILSVIDEVAEQTNLLALNAAIIAAQAGEHGKGFAVVAGEIKQLADRTRNSTREITQVILGVQEETTRAVNAISSTENSIVNGEALADRSVAALNKIFEGVQFAADQMHEIASATLEQTKGSQQIRNAVEQVTQMIGQIDNATREQAQGSELIISASEVMKEITSQVRASAQEQSKVGKFIAGSTENITGMIGQIGKACTEQTYGSNMITESVHDIESSAAVNLEASKVMNEAVARLSEQIELLRSEIHSFRV